MMWSMTVIQYSTKAKPYTVIITWIIGIDTKKSPRKQKIIVDNWKIKQWTTFHQNILQNEYNYSDSYSRQSHFHRFVHSNNNITVFSMEINEFEFSLVYTYTKFWKENIVKIFEKSLCQGFPLMNFQQKYTYISWSVIKYFSSNSFCCVFFLICSFLSRFPFYIQTFFCFLNPIFLLRQNWNFNQIFLNHTQTYNWNKKEVENLYWHKLSRIFLFHLNIKCVKTVEFSLKRHTPLYFTTRKREMLYSCCVYFRCSPFSSIFFFYFCWMTHINRGGCTTCYHINWQER